MSVTQEQGTEMEGYVTVCIIFIISNQHIMSTMDKSEDK